MKTPYGQDCPYFFQDQVRFHGWQRCELLEPARSRAWTAAFCRKCPVPRIRRDNACVDLRLTAAVEDSWLGMRKRLRISAVCRKTGLTVNEPRVGCGLCHHLPEVELAK